MPPAGILSYVSILGLALQSSRWAQSMNTKLLEAASALGMSAWHKFVYITTPIATRLALPAYSNDVVSLLKSTALASTITITDMTGIARTIVAETYAPYEIFISLAIVYMICTFGIQKFFGMVEGILGKYTKRES